MLGVVLANPIAKQVESIARAAGVLVNAPAPDVIRLVPPLVITADQVQWACGVLAAAISRADDAWPQGQAAGGGDRR